MVAATMLFESQKLVLCMVMWHPCVLCHAPLRPQSLFPTWFTQTQLT